MRKAILSLLAIQAGIALAVAAGFYVYQGGSAAGSALYGGAIAMGVSGLLAFRLARAARPGAGLAGLYLGAVERFIFVAVAFAAGIAAIGLPPMPMIAGFGIAELGYFLAAGMLRGERTDTKETGREDGG